MMIARPTPATAYGDNDRLADDLMSNAVDLTASNMRSQLRGLPIEARLALRAAMKLPCGSLAVRLPDGRILRVGGNAPGPEAVAVLHNWKLPRKALTASTIGVAESYMDGDWESPDVTTFLELFIANEELDHQFARESRLFSAFNGFVHWLNRNTPTRARKNISAHYDLGNDFFARWLDPSMTYSSALFRDGVNNLELAQAEKYQALADAAGIGPGDHVLEIGCGWGGFAEFAAREIGCRVTGLTISREQLDFARERIRRAGLSDRVNLEFRDYRDETETYDKVVSIEMFEAVGEEYWPAFFSKLRDVMKPGGRAGLQVITISERAFPEYRANPDFIQRYIFPGGMLPTVKIMREKTAEHGLSLAGETAFGRDYGCTLRIWRERFLDAWPEIAPLGFDERFRRMWEFYLHYCEAGFRQGLIDVRQVIYERA